MSEVCDDRRLLNSLPQWEGVLPLGSSGPTLNEADREMLDWSIANATRRDNKGGYFGGLCQAAIAFWGDEEQVRRLSLPKTPSELA